MVMFIVWLMIGVLHLTTWEIQNDFTLNIGKLNISLMRIQYFLMWIVLLAEIMMNYDILG